MLNNRKLRVFLPVMLVGFLFFGVAAEARQYRSDDRVAKGALVGAAVGTLLQLAQGHDRGGQVLTGAVIGGALGAAAGAATEGYRDRYYRDGSYGYGYQGGEYYPSQGYYQGGYNGGYAPNSYYYPVPRSTGRYEHDYRYDRRDVRRHDRRCRQ